MKTKEERNALKEEVETVNKELHELTEEELEQVSGGDWEPPPGTVKKQVITHDGGHIHIEYT